MFEMLFKITNVPSLELCVYNKITNVPSLELCVYN